MITKKILSQVELFEGISAESLARFAQIAEEVNCEDGEIIFQEGDQAACIYILHKGKVNLQVQLTSRPENLIVAVLSKQSQTFGWSGVVAPYYYTATAKCKAETRLIKLNGKELIKILDDDKHAGYLFMMRIAQMISNRLRISRQALFRTF